MSAEWQKFNFFEIRDDNDVEIEVPSQTSLSSAFGWGKSAPVAAFRGYLIFGAKNGEILFLNLQRASRCVLVTDFDEITHAGIDHSNEAVVFVAMKMLCPYILTCPFSIYKDCFSAHLEEKIQILPDALMSIYKDKKMKPTDIEINEHSDKVLVSFDVGFVAQVKWQKGASSSDIIYECNEEIYGVAYGKRENMYVVTASKLVCLSQTNSEVIYTVSLPHAYTGGLLALQNTEVWEGNHDILISTEGGIILVGSDGPSPFITFAKYGCLMQYYKQYIAIAYSSGEEVGSETPRDHAGRRFRRDSLIIYDCENSAIVYSHKVCADNADDYIYYLFEHNNSLCILHESGALRVIVELDLVDKLKLMVREKAYTSAISIMEKEKQAGNPLPPAALFRSDEDEGRPAVYAHDPLVYLHSKQGDYLFDQGLYDQALDVYLSLPSLHVSHVLEKLLANKLDTYIVKYLEGLHSLGRASPLHSSLMCIFYVYLSKLKELEGFITSKNENMLKNLDLNLYEIPPDIVRNATAVLKNDSLYIEFLIVVEKNYKKAIDFLHNLDIKTLKDVISHHAETLIAKEPKKSCEAFSVLCSKFPDKATESSIHDAKSSYLWPEELAKYFEMDGTLVCYLEEVLSSRWGISLKPRATCIGGPKELSYDPTIVARDLKSKRIICTMLLELYIVFSIPGSESELVGPSEYLDSAMKLMRSTSAEFDVNRISFLCQKHGFYDGLSFLYERLNRHSDLIELYLKGNNVKKVMEICSKADRADLWIRAFRYALDAARLTKSVDKMEALVTIAEMACSAGAFSVSDLIQLVTSATELGTEYAKGVTLKPIEILITKLENTSRELEEKRGIESRLVESVEGAKPFPGECSGCNHKLEFPLIAFRCGHVYHKRCSPQGMTCHHCGTLPDGGNCSQEFT